MKSVLMGIFEGSNKHNVWKSQTLEKDWSLEGQGIEIYNKLKDITKFPQFNELAKELEGSLLDSAVYLASEFHNPWITEGNKICWDYKENKHLQLFHSNLELADYSLIKNFTGKTVTIKCRNGVFALPSGEIMITEFNKCLNNKKNAEKYGIVKLERGETSREIETTTEWCPYCMDEMEIASTGMTQCKCGKWLIPCSMCDMENVDCENCISAKIAEQKNSDNSTDFIF